MATIRSTGKSTKSKKSNKPEKGILGQFLTELDKEIDAKEAGVSRKMTKSEALIKSMVNEALKGDHRMMANVMKIIDKLDDLQAARKEEKEKDTRDSEMKTADWSLTFVFLARNRPYVELELDRRKKGNPATFDLKWEPVKLEDAPWYQWGKDKQ